MSARAEHGHKRILLADDDGDILALVEVPLQRAGYEVLTASDGEEALRLALEERPDLAVLDVNMPKLTGLDVVRAIRDSETTTRVPVIMLSANAQQADSVRGLEAGANDYLTKSFNPRKLLTRVEAALARC